MNVISPQIIGLHRYIIYHFPTNYDRQDEHEPHRGGTFVATINVRKRDKPHRGDTFVAPWAKCNIPKTP
jgi:hypothetical protein